MMLVHRHVTARFVEHGRLARRKKLRSSKILMGPFTKYYSKDFRL